MTDLMSRHLWTLHTVKQKHTNTQAAAKVQTQNENQVSHEVTI